MPPVHRSCWRDRAAWLGLVVASLAVLDACGGSQSDSSGTIAKVVRLTGRPQQVVLPAHATYGIYDDDPDNSGYSLDCTATDAQGRQIHMDDQTPPTISESGTDNLDLVYDTGSGDLTFTCSAAGARTTTRPLTGVVR